MKTSLQLISTRVKAISPVVSPAFALNGCLLILKIQSQDLVLVRHFSVESIFKMHLCIGGTACYSHVQVVTNTTSHVRPRWLDERYHSEDVMILFPPEGSPTLIGRNFKFSRLEMHHHYRLSRTPACARVNIQNACDEATYASSHQSAR